VRKSGNLEHQVASNIKQPQTSNTSAVERTVERDEKKQAQDTAHWPQRQKKNNKGKVGVNAVHEWLTSASTNSRGAPRNFCTEGILHGIREEHNISR
jgi:hypothetical protein